jgi:hypothetical protein
MSNLLGGSPEKVLGETFETLCVSEELPPSQGHKLGQVYAEALQIRIKSGGGAMRSFHNSSFDPQTLLLLETAFDEAWLRLKSVGNKTVKPDELARSVLRVAMEGERDPVRLHDGALERLLPATTWREAS